MRNNSFDWDLLKIGFQLTSLIVLASAGIYVLFNLPQEAINQRTRQTAAYVQTLESTLGATLTPTITLSPTTTFTPTTTYTPTPTPTATLAISKDNNPFVGELEYNVEDSFNILFDPIPIEELKGVVENSYERSVNVLYNSTFIPKYFTWVELRTEQGELLYMIYPDPKMFSNGQEIEIGRYWSIKKGLEVRNHMLAYVFTDNKTSGYSYPKQLDVTIQSKADDGHIDGMIERYTIKEINGGN